MTDSLKILFFYLCCLFVLFVFSCPINAQIKVVQFNAEWNKSNEVDWLNKLTDCKTKFIDIGKDAKSQKKYNVVVVPTIIVFNEGEEVKRFQADLSFMITAKLEDIQEVIDDLIIEDF